MRDVMLYAENLYKKYSNEEKYVIDNLSLHIAKSEKVALLGPSGCGKSTLLHILGTIDTPSSGSVIFKNIRLDRLNDREKTDIRRKHFGFVYQFHNLLHEFSALENVMLPQLISGEHKRAAMEKAKHLLSIFGLYEKLNSRPSELSGGQRQRVAIARAIANSPCLLLADEPTGSLDTDTSKVVMNELMNVLKEFNISAIIATHNLGVAKMLDRSIQM